MNKIDSFAIVALILVATQVSASDPPSPSARSAIVHLVVPAEWHNAPMQIVPPEPPGYHAAHSADGKTPGVTNDNGFISGNEATDLYACGRGTAVHFYSEYREFERKYKSREVNEEDAAAYVAARGKNVLDPVLPPETIVPAYLSIRLALDDAGKVLDAMVVCSTDSGINDSALTAAKSSVFQPGYWRDKPVASLETLDYWFIRR